IPLRSAPLHSPHSAPLRPPLAQTQVRGGGVSPHRVCPSSTPFDTWKLGLIEHIANHPSSRLNRQGKIDSPGLVHNPSIGTAVLCDPRINYIHCNKGCSIVQIARAFSYRMPPRNRKERVI